MSFVRVLLVRSLGSDCSGMTLFGDAFEQRLVSIVGALRGRT